MSVRGYVCVCILRVRECVCARFNQTCHFFSLMFRSRIDDANILVNIFFLSGTRLLSYPKVKIDCLVDDYDDDDDHFYIALFSTLEQTHCARM